MARTASERHFCRQFVPSVLFVFFLSLSIFGARANFKKKWPEQPLRGTFVDSSRLLFFFVFFVFAVFRARGKKHTTHHTPHTTHHTAYLKVGNKITDHKGDEQPGFRPRADLGSTAQENEFHFRKDRNAASLQIVFLSCTLQSKAWVSSKPMPRFASSARTGGGKRSP